MTTRSEALWKQDLRGPWVVVCEDGNFYAHADDDDRPLARQDAILEVGTANLQCECRQNHRAMPKSWADKAKAKTLGALRPEFLGEG